MEDILIKKALEQKLKSNRGKILDLLQEYDLAVLGYQVQEERRKDAYNKVLSENTFYACQDMNRAGIKAGVRITEVDFCFLLSVEDFCKVQELVLPILVAEGMTDKNGCFVENWLKRKVLAMNNLTNFIIANILPTKMAQDFSNKNLSVVFQEKLISIIRGML